MTRILHVSDLHFGASSVPEQVEALQGIVAASRWDAVVVSGDLTQRTRTREYVRARTFLDTVRAHAPVLCVPGNHDTEWWLAPMGLGATAAIHGRYRQFVSPLLEPELRCSGALIVGVNSSQGIRPFTLTTRPRDLSVVGAVRPHQWASAASRLAAAGSDLKVLVLHHNLLRGHLSNRWGLASHAAGITDAAATGADLVLCGHDHEERVAEVTVGHRRVIVSTASTLTTRVRHHRPASFNIIESDVASVHITVMSWNAPARAFAPGETRCFAR